MPPERLRERTRRDERGAVLPIVAIMLVVLVASAAFTVDLGMQRVLRRDMQALADVVALDMARSLDGRTSSAYSSAELDRVRDAAVARNRSVAGVGRDVRVVYRLGRMTEAHVFVASGPEDVPDAVQVSAGGLVDFAFRPGSGASTRVAVAAARATACFSVGTYAVRANLQDGLLLGWLLKILGTNANLSVLDLEGLASTHLDALYLLGTDLGAATYDELLDTSVTLGDFYLATAQALERQSGRTAQVELLERLARLALPAVRFDIGQLLDLDTAGSAALSAQANLLDLVTASAMLANGTNVLAVPNLGVDLGITQLTAGLVVGQKPVLTCGPVNEAAAASSQVALTLGGRLVNLDLGVASVTGPLSVKVDVVPAEGTLTSLTCTPGRKQLGLITGNGLLDLSVDLTLTVKLLPILFGGITVANVPVKLSTHRSQAPTAVTLEVAGESYGGTVSTGQGSLGVPNLTVDVSGASVLGIPAGRMLDWVVAPLLAQVVNPLVQALDAAVLSPVLDLLGINVAGADYTSRPTADCGTPRMVG